MARLTLGSLLAAAVLFGVLGGRAGAEDAAAVAWADTTARVAKGDAPHYLQIRIATRGAVALRHRPAPKDGAGEATWQEAGTWSLQGSRVEVARALEGLRNAMAGAISAAETKDTDGTSLARILLDVEPEAPWRFVQWVAKTAASSRTKIWRLTYLVPGGESLDIDLPKDRGVNVAPKEPAGIRLTLTFLRPPTEGKPPFTQVSVTAGPAPAPAAVEEDIEPEDERDPEPTQAVPAVEIGIAPDGLGEAAVAASWKEVADLLAAKAKGAARLSGRIAAPPPTGGETPYRDVVRGAGLLRAAGVADLALGGPVTPLPK